MADIADIAFRADTSDLANAKTSMEALVPAADKVSKASDKLEQSMASASGAVARGAQANDNYTRSTDAAVGASKRFVDVLDRINRVTGAGAGIGRLAKDSAAFFAEAEAARAKFNPLFAVIQQYKASVMEIREANKMGAISVDEMTAAISRQRQMSLASIAAIKGNGALVQQYGRTAGAASFNTANLAAQFQDVAVTAAMGMNPLQIALQQGTQMALVFGNMGAAEALKTFQGGLLSIISPLSLIIISLTALAAAGLQFINWTAVAKMSLNGLAVAIEYVGPYVVGLAGMLALLYAPQIVMGLATVTAWIVRLGVTALTAGAQMAAAWFIALGPIGMVIAGIAAVVAAAIIFGDELKRILGVDIGAAAKAGVNYLIGSFVAAYHDIVFLWEQFPNVIGAAAIGAANMAITAVNAIIAASITALNTLISAVNSLTSMGGIGEMIGIGQIGKIEVKGFDKLANSAADKLAGAVGARNEQLQKDLTTDYLGAMGGALTTAASTAADKLRELSGGIGADDGSGKKKKGRAGGGGKTEGEKFEDIVNGAERTIATLQAERDAIGLSELATAKLKRQTELLNEAKQKNINLSPVQRDELMKLADTMAQLEVDTKRAQEALDFSKDLVKGFVSDLRSGLKNGESFWDAFADAAMNALDKITDKLLNDVIDALFEVQNVGSGMGGGGGGGILGFLGGLFGGGGGASAFTFAPGMGLWAKGGAFDGGNISKYAKGGTFTNSIVDKPTMFASGGTLGVMGEAGAEAVMPLSRGPDGTLGVEAHGVGNQGGGVVIQIINNASNSQVREERSMDNGIEYRRIIIDTVKSATANGEFDDVNSARYNQRVQKVAR